MHPIEPGTIIGRYVVGRHVGLGRSTRTYEGHHCTTNERVALRVMHSWTLSTHLERDGDFVARFRRAIEARMIQHEHVVEIADVIHADNRLMVVTEWIDAPQLVIRPRTAREVVDIVLQICDATAVHHARGIYGIGIVHEKLYGTSAFKLDTLHIEVPQRMTDNIALIMAMRPRLRTASPELLMGKTTDARSDIYSLGVLAYELAMHRNPYDDGSLPRLVTSILKTPPAPTDLPEHIDATIRRCLNKDRNARFPDVESLRAALID